MAATTELPSWAVYAVSVGTPVSAFLGTVIGQLVTRRGARETEQRSKREEVMRSLRWAAELAISEHPGTSRLGVGQLIALLRSDLLDNTQRAFVVAALQTVYREPIEELDELDEAGVPADAIEIMDDGGAGATEDVSQLLDSALDEEGGDDG